MSTLDARLPISTLRPLPSLNSSFHWKFLYLFLAFYVYDGVHIEKSIIIMVEIAYVNFWLQF